MTGIESALIGAVSNAVSKEVLSWIKDRGPDFTESDWKETGKPILRQIRASHKQFRTGYNDSAERNNLQREIRTAGKILRELQYIGEERDFDSEVVELYSELADLMAEWDKSPEIDLGGQDAGPYADRFEELYDKNQELM